MDSLVREFEADFPDDELVVYRSPRVEALIAMPKAKLAELAAAGVEPFWRHGEVMQQRAAEAS